MIEKKRIRGLIALFIIALSTAVVSACNTVEGVGEDVESTGDAIQGAAEGAH